MIKAPKLSAGFAGKVIAAVSAFAIFVNQGITAEARGTAEFSNMGTGISNILSPVTPLGIDEEAPEVRAAVASLMQTAVQSTHTSASEDSTLFMANVNSVMNVREEPGEDSTKVGVLYKDCGGKILARQDGWTKIQSGDLIGWAKDEFLFFDDDAKSLASDVGKQIVTSNTSALNVRKEASQDAEVLGIITEGSFVDFIEDLGDGWYSVDYNDETGYVQSEYASTSFRIDEGETIASIKLREERESAEKAAAQKSALKKNRGAVSADADEVKLLAALIQCEAGNQPYDGKVGVGAVVLNRVRSGAYPSTIYGVIYASGQFTPAQNGAVAKVYNSGNISESNYQAARDAISGATTVGDACHFRRVNGRSGIIIGEHVFW